MCNPSFNLIGSLQLKLAINLSQETTDTKPVIDLRDTIDTPWLQHTQKV